MENSAQHSADLLFENRQTFLRFNRFKIERTFKTLSDTDRLAFLTIPRLLHIHLPGLPGYIEGDVPGGIFNYVLDHESRLACERLFPETLTRRNPDLEPVIESVLLIGSIGSIAQTEKSDLDYTLLIDRNRLTPKRLNLLKKKLRLIEDWTWKKFRLEIHFFINDTRQVRHNHFGESDSESTGSALAKLLKEEMYRTMILVAGKIPFWWVVPVDTDDQKYENLVHLVNSGQTLLHREEFIDIGNVDDISPREFFGGSIWSLIKSFKSPFKTLMKMGLLEDYMFNETRFNLLCHEVKKKIHSGNPFSEIDPYLILFDRVHDFFSKSKTDDEIDALRTAFYLKVGTQVDSEDMKHGSSDPDKAVLVKMIREWNWAPFKIEHLNDYSDWRMMDKVALGNRVNRILMSSYKNISEQNESLGQAPNLITKRDTHLLGRKLFSFYRKAAHKVENLFALVDGKTAERELTFLFHQDTRPGPGAWYLIRGKTLANVDKLKPETIIKKSNTLAFLIAFATFNNLFDEHTDILLRAEEDTISDQDLKILLEQVSSFIARVNIAGISNEELMAEAYIKQLFLILDFGSPFPAHIVLGDIERCNTNQELTSFINQRVESIRHLSTIYLTSWGEMFSKTYSGLNCMGRALNGLSPSIHPDHLDDPGFLKIFIPSGRKDPLEIPWLNSYILRSLKLRGAAFYEKAAI